MNDRSTLTHPKSWLRGILEPCLLALLGDGECYGYELGSKLEDAGLGPIPGGSLYPALLRMEKNSLIESEWKPGKTGPGRKYYRLTETGKEQASTQPAQWMSFSNAVHETLLHGERTE